jgi:hypothetical protein
LEKSSWEKEKEILIVVDIIENWKPLGCYYKCTTQGVFGIFVLQIVESLENLNLKLLNSFSKIDKIQQRSAKYQFLV